MSSPPVPSDPAPLPCWPRYGFFSDNSMARRSVMNQRAPGEEARLAATPVYDFGETERSGKADFGWDKYYFFSDPACKTMVHKTARLGRNRPASLGPQTFLISPFSEEQFSKALQQDREGKSDKGRTIYAQSFSQLARTGRALSAEELPPLSPVRSMIAAHVPGSPNKNIKKEEAERKLAEQRAEAEAKKALLAQGIQTKAEKKKPEMPPNATMSPHIFPNGHVTSDQLFAQDRRAPGTFSYTGGMSMAFR